MLHKKIALYILVCCNFTILGHSTHIQPYERIFSNKDHESIEQIKAKIKTAILRNDNSANLKDSAGATLLICAIETGEPELVRYLIREWHADINQAGVPQADVNAEWKTPVFPLEFAQQKLELSAAKADRVKWRKIIHYLEKAQNSDEILI